MTPQVYVRAVLAEATRSTVSSAKYREIVFQPRSSGYTIDAFLEEIASRRPQLRDYMTTGGALSADLRRILRATLTPVQQKRVEAALLGGSLETIAASHGCSKQAIHKSLGQSYARLKKSAQFQAWVHTTFSEVDLDAS